MSVYEQPPLFQFDRVEECAVQLNRCLRAEMGAVSTHKPTLFDRTLCPLHMWRLSRLGTR